MTQPILIIEDDADLSRTLQDILELEGHNSTIIGDGAVALEQLPQIETSLIILDMHLPNVSGLEIIQYIRNQPAISDTKICVMTADPQMAAMAQNLADQVHIKPMGLQQIDEILSLLS